MPVDHAVNIRKTRWSRVRRALAGAPVTAWLGMFVMLVYAITALFAPLIAPYGQAEIVARAYQPPSVDFFLGTDQIGRDILSRLIYAARNTIGIALLTTTISFAIGGTLGIAAALNRRWLDHFLSRSVDALLSIPTLIFALMLLAVFGRNIMVLILVLAVLDSTRVFRLARATALNVVVMDYVEAATLRGEGPRWIIFHETLPNILPPLATEFGLRFCFVFLTISALSFLGVGIQPPTADWGAMVAETKQLIIYGNPAPLYPAIAIGCLTIAVNFVVDWFVQRSSGLRDDA